MKVSIISPVFNSSSMLEELVQRINKTMDNLNLQNNKVIIPQYFSPFKKKNIRINFAYKFLKKKFETNFTLGDCDQDRPN